MSSQSGLIASMTRRFLMPRVNRRRSRLAATVVRADPASWAAPNLMAACDAAPRELLDWIGQRVRQARDHGPQSLWEGYRGLTGYPLDVAPGATRTSVQVSIGPEIGKLLVGVALQRRPRLIVEVGTGFGVSGMYLLAALEAIGGGRLVTFEPNQALVDIARGNLASIGTRFEVVGTTLEDGLAALDARGERLDIAFVDGIHTSAVVLNQVEMLTLRSSPGALIFLDDIDFSADMRSCWTTLAGNGRYGAAIDLGRVGVLEIRR